MTTATTNTVLDQTTDAGFRTWIAEVIAQLLAVGVTQTADTGQVNTATVTRPAVNTSAGYAIFRFNDTAHSTLPIFFKLEFGSGGATTTPQMWITVGNGSNGSGTINGTGVMTRVACSFGAPASTITPYVSRFCYNATQGVLWMGWKYAGAGTANATMGGFSIIRSTDSAGAPTTDAFQLITNSSTATGSSSSAGFVQVISGLSGLTYNTAPWPNSTWAFQPYSLTVTLYSSNAQCFPVMQYTPVVGVSASMALALIAEVGLGSTVPTVALIGATTHTFIQAGAFWGGTSVAQCTGTNTTIGALMLWE